jgi:arylsulfatase
MPSYENPTAPNILLITTDQHRGDCLGIAGHPAVMTPNLDYWFESGAYFPRAYSEAPTCIPARRALISGMSPFGCGLPGYQDGVPFDPPTTMMHEFRANGWQTMCSGKMHFSPQRKHHGFETMVLHEGQQRFDDYIDDYDEWLKARSPLHERQHGMDSNSWMARPSHLPEELHNTTWTVDAAIELLRRRDPTRPFFLWLSFVRPHAPLDPPQVYWDMYADAELPPPSISEWSMKHAVPPPLEPNAWRGFLNERDQRRAQIGYYACITQIDHQIGRLLEEMRRLDCCNETFMAMTADHGEMLGDHHLWRKSYAYEGSARVPFLMRFPTRGPLADLPTGQAHQHVVGLQDVMPTLLDVAGLDIPEHVEGRSLLPLLRDDQSGGAQAEWREFLHGEHADCYDPDESMHYLTDGQRKYIWFPYTGDEQFFDLVADPGERDNLAQQPDHADEVALWRGRLVAKLADRGDGFSDGTKLIQKQFTLEPYIEEHPYNQL